jgi:transcriptional regulator GlxA family with amidase domain
MKNIGILIFEGVEELDAFGPWEVLAWWTQNFPDDGYRVSLVSRTGEPIRAAKGLIVTPQMSTRDAEPFEVFLHPGGQGARQLMRDPDHLAWIREIATITPLMTSVCTGSLVYAAAGLLRGRPATTYWDSLHMLTDLDPNIETRPDDRWVDDGNMLTSAGVSAGIDMSLHLVSRLVSPDRARAVRRGIQYDPHPPV